MKNKTKKKIAILYSGGRFFGGIEQYLINLFKYINRDVFELELLSLGQWPLTEQLNIQGDRVVIFSEKRINPKTISDIGRYLKDNKFDLLVSQGTVANAYARVISFRYKIPNLVTVHSTRTGDYSNPLIRTVYSSVEKMTRFPTKKYIAVSQYLKDQMAKGGLSADKISVVYNGLNFPKPEPQKHGGIVIGSVGRLHPVKGFDRLIEAFAELKDKKVLLKIAGSGDELDNLKNLAAELGVSDRVEFVGFQKDIYKFLNTIDIYVQSSISEGFGLAVVEAMSQGLPVVVTPAGSLVEIVENNKTGLISDNFEPESLTICLERLLTDGNVSQKMGDSARKNVIDNFGIDRWIEGTENAYQEAIK